MGVLLPFPGREERRVTPAAGEAAHTALLRPEKSLSQLAHRALLALQVGARHACGVLHPWEYLPTLATARVIQGLGL